MALTGRESELDVAVFDEEDERLYKELDHETYNKNSVYNMFGFKPVLNEITHGKVVIEGTLPADLEGIYIRNSGNPQFDPPSLRYHMFGGAGMLHQVQIKDGVATYSNTFVRSPRYEAERAFGREIYIGFSDLATAGSFVPRRIASIERKIAQGLIPRLAPLESTTSSTAIQYHHGRLYALNETGYPFVLNTNFREDGRLVIDGTGHLENWNGTLTASFSAHPRIPPENGDFFSVVPSVGNKMTVTHIQDGKLRECITFDQPSADGASAGHCHDYFLTENYLVFPDISLRSSDKFLSGPDQSRWKFNPDYKLRWGVLPRNFKKGDLPRWFVTSRAGSLWHMVNGWEETRADGGTDIVLFAPMFESYPSDLPIHTPEEPPAKLHKWVLNLEAGTVTEDRRLLEHGYERPSANLDYIGKKSQYGYLIDEERDGYLGKGVLKYDLLAEKEVKYFDYGEYYGGEALFVPRKGSTAEDDGYLLELLMAPNDACLIVIDAATMEELARLRLPQRVPFGVHACWLDTEKLAGISG